MRDSKIRYINQLKALSALITVADRSDAQNELPISRPTLDKYLSGDIVKIETANQLIDFFTRRVNKRIKEYKSASVE